jgi:Protein of unknown function (DUF2484)
LNLSLTLASIWVLAMSALAFLPARRQNAPVVLLLVLLLPLLVMLVSDFGAIALLPTALVLLSLLRRPIFHGLKRLKRLTGGLR